jgi:hypothetical protein
MFRSRTGCGQGSPLNRSRRRHALALGEFIFGRCTSAQCQALRCTRNSHFLLLSFTITSWIHHHHAPFILLVAHLCAKHCAASCASFSRRVHSCARKAPLAHAASVSCHPPFTHSSASTDTFHDPLRVNRGISHIDERSRVATRTRPSPLI